MDTLTAGFIGTAIGGAITHLSGFVQWKRQLKHEHNRFLIAKLEELCGIVIQIQKHLNKDSHDALRGAIPLKDAQRQYTDVPITQMEMLVGLHFPRLQPYAAKIASARDMLAMRISDSLRAHESKDTDQSDCHLLTAADSTQATGACDDFLRAATKEAIRFT